MKNSIDYNLTFKGRKLLSPGTSNAKLAKNELESYILYLSPADQNSKGINVCPNASAACIIACLNTAGLAGVYSSIIQARILKTDFYLFDRAGFINKLTNELISLSKRAQRNGKKIAVRLNGTSDLDFIAIIKNRTDIDVLELPGLIFYDYTKTLGKVKKYANSKYILTFSRSENNELDCIEALQYGANVAAVFKKNLPAVYMDRPVVDGDASDIVMLENRSTILGLKAKGRAKKDVSGFVIA